MWGFVGCGSYVISYEWVRPPAVLPLLRRLPRTVLFGGFEGVFDGLPDEVRACLRRGIRMPRIVGGLGVKNSHPHEARSGRGATRPAPGRPAAGDPRPPAAGGRGNRYGPSLRRRRAGRQCRSPLFPGRFNGSVAAPLRNFGRVRGGRVWGGRVRGGRTGGSRAGTGDPSRPPPPEGGPGTAHRCATVGLVGSVRGRCVRSGRAGARGEGPRTPAEPAESLPVLEEGGDAPPAADAEGGDPVAGAASPHLVEESHHDAGAGGADGMAEGDGATVPSQPVGPDVRIPEVGERLGAKASLRSTISTSARARPGRSRRWRTASPGRRNRWSYSRRYSRFSKRAATPIPPLTQRVAIP